MVQHQCPPLCGITFWLWEPTKLILFSSLNIPFTENAFMLNGFDDWLGANGIRWTRWSNRKDRCSTSQSRGGRYQTHFAYSWCYWQWIEEGCVCWDTDVLLLLLHYFGTSNAEVFMNGGLQQNNKVYPVHAIAQRLPAMVLENLPTFHVFTVCDTNSSFADHGKKTYWKVLMEYH